MHRWRTVQLLCFGLFLSGLIAGGLAHIDENEESEDENYDTYNDAFDDHFQHDEGHVKAHMDGVSAKSNMTKEELEFYTFKEHDYDNNTMLDGWEIMAQLMHGLPFRFRMTSGTDPTQVSLLKAEQRQKWFTRITTMIDKALNEHDLNKDGYLSYPEYAAAARHKSLKTHTT